MNTNVHNVFQKEQIRCGSYKSVFLVNDTTEHQKTLDIGIVYLILNNKYHIINEIRAFIDDTSVHEKMRKAVTFYVDGYAYSRIIYVFKII